jgi:hypothetical protein
MKKTAKEKEEHLHRAMLIINQLGEEYAAWYGSPRGFGRNVALGEYILDITADGQNADEWYFSARMAYLEWNKKHNILTDPPLNP